MKLTVFFLLVTIFNVFGSKTYSQNARLNLDMKDVPIQTVLNAIEGQSEFFFLYSSKMIDVNQKVDINVADRKITEVLDELLANTDIKYAVRDRQILLVNKETETATLLQQISVSGTVTDASTGEAMAGVNIQVKGTTIGNISDINGKYSIPSAVDQNAILVFSFIGYVTQEVPMTGKIVIDVALAGELTGLEEVVVIGYGTVKKSNLTGSVARVSSDKLTDRPVVSAAEAIAGQVAGVQIQTISGAPGGEGLSIRVRGTGSITQSSEPLYVVDGYPMEGSVFRLLNTSDITNIEILKDASSTAIYGSRGANGVIIITTKKGEGKPSVNFNMYTGFQQREKTIKMMNRNQYVQYFIDGRNQAWSDAGVITADPNQTPHLITDPNSRRKLYPNYSNSYMIPDGQDGYLYNFLDPQSVAQMPDNNWQDLIFRNAKMQQYELSFNGGSEKTQYVFSASYIQQDGIVINTDYKRINARTNINSQINDRFRVGININSYFSTGHENVEGKYSPIQIALQLPPIFPIKNSDGIYGSMVRNYEIFAGDVSSPIGLAEQTYDYRKRDGWMGILFAEWEIFKDLNYKISLNGGIQDNNLNYYLPSYIDMDASRAPRTAIGQNDKRTDMDWVIEQTLTFNKTFSEKHNLTALAGYSTQKHSYNRLYGEARGFPNDNIYTLNAGTMYNLIGTESEYSMISYLARINYNYDNKYLLSAAFRSDGSSRFGKGNKWGYFPSLSVAWRIKQENFMQDIKFINDLKIRSSFGIAGNNRIGDYSAIGLLNVDYYPTGDALQNTVDPNTMPNDILGWEKVEQADLGFDLGLFGNRIRLEVDFYNSKSLELLLNVPVPSITGYSSQMQNIGKVQNRGMEYLLSTKNLVNKFKWSSDFNISFNKNKVLALGPDGRPIYASAPNANNAFITQIGYPIASYYGYVYEGVFMSQADLDKYPHLPGDKVGDGRYLDVNGDGKMDQNDKEILGNNQPIFTAGFNNNFEYKNFSLGIQFTGSYGAKVFSIYKRMIAVYHGDRNGMIGQLDRWRSTEDLGNGQVFRASRTPSGWSRDPSSYWVTDGSYLRLRNVSLAYNFDVNKIKKLNMRELRIYITGQNIYTLTKNPGYDPESSSEGSGLTKGGDYLGYPTARSVILGVNVTF